MFQNLDPDRALIALQCLTAMEDVLRQHGLLEPFVERLQQIRTDAPGLDQMVHDWRRMGREDLVAELVKFAGLLDAERVRMEHFKLPEVPK